MQRFKPMLFTSLFVGLLYNVSGLYVSIIVLLITVTVTYICFTLNTRLRLEKIIAYIIKFSFQEATHPVAPLEDGFQRKHNRLKALPLPFQKISNKFITSIINDYIKTWYVYIGPSEKDFIIEVKDALECIAVELYIQLKSTDVENIIINLIRMFQRHVKIFDDCRTIVQNKYSGINDEDLCNCITELYEAANIRHIATHTKGAEIDYIKALLDIFLFRFLPDDAFACEGGRFMLREILTIKLLEPLIKDLTDSHFVNQAVVELLEPSIPLPIIIDQWDKVFDDLENLLQADDDDVSSAETDYGSGLEEHKSRKSIDHSSQIDKQINKSIHKSSDKPISNIFEAPQMTSKKVPSMSPKKIDMKRYKNEIHKPLKKETSKSRKNENVDQRTKELLRFDKLDMRTAAPVYGSVSVRDHEQQRDPMKGNAVSTYLSDSSLPSHERSMTESFHTLPLRLDTDIAENPRQWPSVWTVCPSSDASIFRQSSFIDMSRKQDEIAEQMKARLSHLDLPTIKSRPWLDHPFPERYAYTQDVELNDDFSGRDVMLKSAERDARELESFHGSPSQSNTEILSDASQEEEVDPAAGHAMCVEMTLMASPFEIDKEKVLIDPKKNPIEHDCGLNSKHFYYAETETAILSGIPPDDHFFASCEDIHTEALDLSLSPPDYPNSQSGSLGENIRKDSYDLVSSVGSHSLSYSEYSTDSLGSYDDVEQFQSDEEFSPSKDGLHSPSVMTHKKALDDDNTIPIKQLDSLSSGKGKAIPIDDSKQIKSKLKRNLNRSNNKVINFFKGFHSLSKKRRLLSKSSVAKFAKDVESSKKNRSREFGKRPRYKGAPSSSASTTHTKFISIPDNNSSSLPTHVPLNDQNITEYVEEVALEALEDDDTYSDHFPNTNVDPLSKEITVNAKGLSTDSHPLKTSNSIKESPRMKSTEVLSQRNTAVASKEDNSKLLQLYEGEVIKPHPSKIPAAWLYPIQMISIPGTEIAIEKGWERGINKYTLYNIHYDIRIWPDQRQSDEENSTLLIREIKRRYREFIYLHNRFSHGHLSKNMKGILRPNRRYALPFGRMDPDVIEGRRRILEMYLVSVVSRPELCNSREFNEFLGSENHEDLVVVKPTTIPQKQMCNSQMGKVLRVPPEGQTSQSGYKEQKGLQYFIHGYEVQRMFGYADNVGLEKSMLLRYFIDNYETVKKTTNGTMYVTQNEPIQVPYTYSNEYHLEMREITRVEMREMTREVPLSLRTAGDGAEATDLNSQETSSFTASVVDDPLKKLEDTSFSVIAAKFSPELALKLERERENRALSIAHEKDLYESSWPMADAVLSIVCQALKGYGSWICFERVQQAILFSLGGVIEWLIKRELDEFTMKERWYKYFCDLYSLVWTADGRLKKTKPEPTETEREKMKEQALKGLMEIIPRVVMMSIGQTRYGKGCENLLHTLQYQTINRHLLFAALEIIVFDLIPDLGDGYPEYTSLSQPPDKTNVS